jgi:hypothetical protein
MQQISCYQLIRPNSKNAAMKMALASSYRSLLLTLRLGKATLWLQSLNCRLRLEEDGVTLRNHGKVPWSSIRKIGISRNYLDGHLSEIRIHHRNGVSKISMRGLRDGEKMVRAILKIFELTRRGQLAFDRPAIEPTVQPPAFSGSDRSPTEQMPEPVNQTTKPSSPIAIAA